MSGYFLRMDSMRDAVEISGASAQACNPNTATEMYDRVTKDLWLLITDAPQLGIENRVVDALRRI